MFENIFENDGTVSKKLNEKHQKMQSSPHKWVLGKILQKLKGCLGIKFARVLFMCMCVCVLWATPATKKR